MTHIPVSCRSLTLSNPPTAEELSGYVCNGTTYVAMAELLHDQFPPVALSGRDVQRLVHVAGWDVLADEIAEQIARAS